MEIEAKLEIDDKETFERILGVSRLGPYQLASPILRFMTDTYYDTRERTLLENAYCCRLRETVSDNRSEGVEATVKSLAEPEDEIHRRTEMTVELDRADSDPVRWPPSEVRNLVLSLCAGSSLVAMFSVAQGRHQREVSASGRLVAEMSLDLVTFGFPTDQDHYTILEFELFPDGTLEDLENLVYEARSLWKVRELRKSKFQMALSFMPEDHFSTRSGEY